jgi:hypothetical protein
MTATLETPPMPKPKRDDESVKIDRTVLQQAKIVAAYLGITVAEYLSDRLRPLVAEDHGEQMHKFEGAAPPPRRGRKGE